MSFCVYIGPFLRVPTFRKKVSVSSYQCEKCGNKQVDKLMSFCPKCGGRVVASPHTRLELGIPRPYDLPAELSEVMFIAESSYLRVDEAGYIDWLPNKRGFGVYLGSDASSEPVILSGAARDEALAHFLEHHQALMKSVEAQFGVRAQLLYGAVPYWS